jgi:hypothetical protein
LVVVFSVNNVPVAIVYFDFVQNLFVFFTANNSRFKKLQDNMRSNTTEQTYTLKKLSDTRWSCRADATKALIHNYASILEVLNSIMDDTEEKDVVKSQARGLAETMSRLETAIFTEFWHKILERVNATSLSLQNPAMDVNSALVLMRSLRSFVEGERDRFDSYEVAGKKLSATQEYRSERIRRANVRRQPFESSLSDTQLTPRDKFRTEAFLAAIDSMLAALDQRIKAYEEVCERFGFLRNLGTLCKTAAGVETLGRQAQKLVDWYPEDLEPSLGNELKQLDALIKEFDKKPDEAFETFCIESLLKVIRKMISI